MKRLSVIILFLLLFAPSAAFAKGFTSFKIISATNSGGAEDTDEGVASMWTMETTRVPTPTTRVKLFRRATYGGKSTPYTGRLVKVYYSSRSLADVGWDIKLLEGKTNSKGELSFPMKQPGRYRVYYGGNDYYRGITIRTFHKYLVAHTETYTVDTTSAGTDKTRATVNIDFTYNPYVKPGRVTTICDLFQFNPALPWYRHLGVFQHVEDESSNLDLVAGTRHMEFSTIVTNASVVSFPTYSLNPSLRFEYPYVVTYPEPRMD